jgi:hypothetical protein
LALQAPQLLAQPALQELHLHPELPPLLLLVLLLLLLLLAMK